VVLPSRYQRQLCEICPSGLRWPSPLWEPGENQCRSHQTTIQALPSQRAATTRTEHELQDQATVYAKGHTLSSYRVQIRGESTLGLSLRDLGVFFSFSNFYLNNASSVGQTRCHRSNHLFICVFSTQQPMFESMEPKGGTRQVYISPPPSDVLYLIRKTGGVKGQRPTK